MIHGEVLMPNAISWQKGMDAEDYIEKIRLVSRKVPIRPKLLSCAKMANRSNVDDIDHIEPGDEIMVLPKVDTKNIEITKGFQLFFIKLLRSSKSYFEYLKYEFIN